MEIRSVERALLVLEALRESEQGLSELSRNLELPKATLLRLLVTLMKHGYIEKDENNQKYRLGLKVMHLGMSVIEKFDLKRIGAPFLQEIWQVCGETVYLNVMHENEVLCIDCIHGRKDVRVVAYTGRKSPLYVGASGKAILAFLPMDKIEEYVKSVKLEKIAPGTIVDPDQLLKNLLEIRERGYATSLEERFSDALGTSAPVFDGVNNKVIGSVSITAPSNRTETEIQEYITLVTDAALEISRKLGYRYTNEAWGK
ncbi:MAG: IclR family transcriptional regulator [Syntrophomonadaceae bacterium]|jgi:IclR family KDG regulon transcriptional repressor